MSTTEPGLFRRLFPRLTPASGTTGAPGGTGAGAASPTQSVPPAASPTASPTPTPLPSGPMTGGTAYPFPQHGGTLRRPSDLWEKIEHGVALAVPAILVITVIMTVTLLATGSIHRIPHAETRALSLGLAVLFASITLIFLARLLRSLESGDSLGVESHWGGLGGGVGGWRISRPVVYLICVATFAALTALVVTRYDDGAAPAREQSSAGQKTASTAADEKANTKTSKAGTADTPATTSAGTITQGGAGQSSAPAGAATQSAAPPAPKSQGQ